MGGESDNGLDLGVPEFGEQCGAGGGRVVFVSGGDFTFPVIVVLLVVVVVVSPRKRFVKALTFCTDFVFFNSSLSVNKSTRLFPSLGGSSAAVFSSPFIDIKKIYKSFLLLGSRVLTISGFQQL